MYIPYKPKKILIEKSVIDYPYTKEILERLPLIPYETILDSKNLNEIYSNKEASQILFLRKQTGKFLKPCPCTPKHVTCGYYFINIGTNCSLNCTYCIMQQYLDNSFMTVYLNLDDLFLELDEIFKREKDKFFRIGTGELTDSLFLDNITHMSEKLIPFFLKYNNAMLELKTKTPEISNLIKYNTNKKVMISWSLNPQTVIDNDEKKSASLEERLNAAKKCLNGNYLLGFHFDPLVYYENWENDYHNLIKILFDTINHKSIGYISLGSLRYHPKMDDIIRKNHPYSKLPLGEFIHGMDNKLRYFRGIREEMFKSVRGKIKEYSKDTEVYLCMESIHVWRNVFGEKIFMDESLPSKLKRKVRAF